MTGWAGIAIHFNALVSGPMSWPLAVWTLIGYFTITTNLLVAIVLTGVALGVAAFKSPSLLAGTLLSILLVGIVYALLLRGLRELTAGSELANILLHQATPLMVTAFWLVFVGKGVLRWRDPLLWALYPLGYFLYALARGAVDGHYPYPFINVAEIGLPRTREDAGMIAAAFVLAGEALIWFDHWLAARAKA
ncbi:hypothetical protein EN943_00265 [Mesorhizobium sp. M7A.F.Ca.US.006.01.1.1]|uniref:Pr6Pr family membrane protein n=1 Tax=Mesorhizobium sp. M7A.F.Ca.US.006.01.1.1 TaxID=2496707 RepID=UPI000FCBC515|nr:Pr6Pr family membrane protein [Mesorhizobium sp. M7A.F.Ca.US.006.01.1.1]RUZ81531.1 hypothetical protein EN943_00265 [Mesorhizobium sp. M7A.F.Ca.US.006.01.1.1]